MRSLKRHHFGLRDPLIVSLAACPTRTITTTSPTTSALPPLLIANRGEIALRIARTAHKMGIPTTMIHSPVDSYAPHAACPTALRSLTLPSVHSYLDGPALVALARHHGLGAVHPGYGFLSENAAFASLCEEAGLVFVGPPSRAMEAMGDKARSKTIMEEAGVRCVPGYHGGGQSLEDLASRADEVGYPVLLKSVMGGGGKGMRVVRDRDEFAAQLRSARQEARASFGDGGETMLVEKYIVRPRHIEVQIFADRHGSCVTLGERDCSVQRRHQKILEESPAPHLDESVRQDLWQKAKTAALAVGYVGAGTVEFILDKDTGEFFFMEMNTRLQVEHPVSEMVTGTDLVEWQFRVAAGEPLPLTQEEIEARILERGHAIEARIYAENPARGFLPDSGKLVHLKTPATDEHVRIDAGFGQGDTIAEAYDGMIAKLIIRARDRETAIRRMDLSLQDYQVFGLSTNIEFLKKLCRSPAFAAADVETGFIDKHTKELFTARQTPDEVFAQAALAILTGLTRTQHPRQQGPHGETLGFGEASVQSQRKFAFRVRDDALPEGQESPIVDVCIAQVGSSLFDVVVTPSGSDRSAVVFENVVCESAPVFGSGNKTTLASFFPLERIASTVLVDLDHPESVTVFQHGVKTDLHLLQPDWYNKALGLKEAAVSVAAPMPCKILRNEVAEGEQVEKGAPLVVIESMKMEMIIRSPQKGVIRKLAHKEGDICKAGTVLVLFKEGAESTASS